MALNPACIFIEQIGFLDLHVQPINTEIRYETILKSLEPHDHPDRPCNPPGG
jgi:hypothetical protein